MLRRLILLIYCTGWAAAAAVSGSIVDDCDYSASPSQTRCGDICTRYNKFCDCGGERLLTNIGPSHCCMAHSPVISQQCDKDSDGHGICHQGTVDLVVAPRIILSSPGGTLYIHSHFPFPIISPSPIPVPVV